MNEEEKKAVKILNTFEFRGKTRNYKEISSEDSQSVEIVLNLIEKLQKENKKLKNKLLDTLKGQKVIKEETPQYIKENYIPVEKVKDKIEEILNNKEYRIVFEGNAEFPDDATIINAQKYIKLEKMQELIEEREEK